MLVSLGLAALAVGAVASLAAPALRRADVPAGAAETNVDVELVLAVDISYSMDPDEQALQREGYVAALTSPEFLNALRQGCTARSLRSMSSGPARPNKKSSSRGG